MNDPMLPLPGLSSASGKPVVVKFDGGLLSSDGGVLALREVEQRLRVADRLAACMIDPRAADQITHSLADVIRFRLLMISAGYEDGNDANALRRDPMFKMALDLSPIDRELCSQSTISRLENLPDVRAVLRMGRAMVDLYCESFATVPKRITLDIDDTFDAVHGGQQLRLFNAHYDEYGFQPIVVFDGEGRFVTAVLRPAKRPSGKEIKPFLRRLLRAIRAHWPNTEILLRADSHYCGPEVLDWCRANRDIAPPCRRSRSQHEGEIRGGVARRQASSFHGVLRRRAKLEPGRADHRPRRSGRGRTGHPLRRHQSEQTQRSRALRGCLLPARPGRKPYQVLEDPSGGGSHVLLQGDSQPVSAVPACGRLLADVGPTRVDAKAFDVARRPVRHVAPPPHQDCRPRRRDEDHDPGALADLMPRSGYPSLRSGTHTAPRHMTDGA